jgi:HK97 family phage major capsid protein
MTERLTFASSITSEGRRMRGSVLLAGQRTPRNGELWEIDPAALVKADASKAVFAVGHQAGADMNAGYDPLRVAARADNGSMRLTRHETGFDFETDELPNTTFANDLLALAEAGLLGGVSFEIGGLRSSFSTDPETGTRIRRLTSIAQFTAVTPVVDPAFPSTVAAFSKESDVTDIIEEPVAAPTPDAPAKFTEQPKSGADEWAAFAAEIPTDQLVAQMDAIFSSAGGDLKGELLDRYEGFARVVGDRKKSESVSKARIERMQALHNLRLGRVPAAPESGLLASDDYRNAWFGRSGYARTGDANILAQFAQSIAGDGTQGGYMVPESSLARITERRKAFGGVQRFAENITTSDGRPLPWPTNDDTANSAVIATEGAAAASGGADLVLGEIMLSAYSYDATGASNLPLAISKELLQDAAFDVEAFITRKLGERLGRKIAADLATADGSSKPKGLFNKTADAMTATTMYAALVEHILQVDQEYRESGNCRWLMSDTTWAKVLASVDKNGRPLFQPSGASGGQSGPSGFLLDYPVSLDQGAGNLVSFGDVYAGYIVRNVRGVTIDVDPYTLIS